MTQEQAYAGRAEPVFFSERAFRAIEGREPRDQLDLLREYVEQAVRDKDDGFGPSLDEINIVRRRYIRIASELYRGLRA